MFDAFILIFCEKLFNSLNYVAAQAKPGKTIKDLWPRVSVHVNQTRPTKLGAAVDIGRRAERRVYLWTKSPENTQM